MSDIDSVFGDILTGAQERFGKDACYSGDGHKESILGVKVPLIWGWFIGGCDVVPLRRAIGCDGKSGTFKSVLMSLEHAIWFLRSGGVVVLVDTEEKTSESLIRAYLHKLPPEVRKRFIYMKARSLDEAQQMVSYYKAKAAKVQELPPEQQFPIYVAWDSLLGADSEAAQERVVKEGNAQARSFSDAALSIAKFYKALVFDQSWLTLGHVQHAKQSMDPNAVGDDQMVAGGGTEPRFKATYHFRTLSSKVIESADCAGKEITIKCIKCGLGPDKRTIRVRIQWRYVWVELPEFVRDAENNPIEIVPGEGVIPAAEVEQYYTYNQQALSWQEALMLKEFLRVGSGEDAPKPKSAPFRFQQMWTNWDWALGNFLVEYKYGDGTYAKEKEDLKATLEFVQVGKDVKCREVFGDDTPRSVEEFGAAIEASPEVRDRLRRFMGVVSYQDVHAAAQAQAAPAKAKKRGKKE